LGTLIGAVFLRAAIALYNAMAGGKQSPSSVPEPSFGKAMGITFVTTLVNFGVSLVVNLATGGGAAAAGPTGTGGDLVGRLAGFVISLLIMATMLSAMLPTTFGRAMLVTLCYMLIVLLVVGVIVLVMILAFGVAFRGP
jgi:hypothetical protein